jgi:hypothetical protein
MIVNCSCRVMLTTVARDQWVLPEVAAQAVLTLLLLVTGNWLEFVLNLPLLAWHIKLLVLFHRGCCLLLFS